MNSTIICPRCRNEFEITEVMHSQLTDQIRAELESDIATRRVELDVARAQINGERADIEAAWKGLDDRVRAQVDAQKAELATQARREAAEELSIELRDRDQQVAELQQKLKTAENAELALRQRERELQAKTDGLALEMARQLDAERDRIRTAARQQFDQEHQMKDAEKEKQISDLRRQIDDLKRSAEQGSQQRQGEVQELALENLLRCTFTADTLEPVPPGLNGGDTLQRVLDRSGLFCGSILWESKRTRNWSNGWLPKLRDDQRAAGAACAVIVSEALPDGIHTFALVEGVWICNWSCVTALAAALRVGMIEVAKSRLAVQGQHDKMEMVYNYLASQEFRHRVAGIVEPFITMQKDLGTEKRSMQRIWSKREKQIERALMNTAGMYGDLQGIIGASLPVIEGLATPRLESLDEFGQDEVSPIDELAEQPV
jgi:hypothetical protein